jgi:hypothetical protein
MEAAGEPHRLDYAPPRRWTRRRKRIAALAAALVLIGGAGWRWGPDVRDRLNFLHRQLQCMKYEAPADRVVLSSEPSDIAALMGTSAHFMKFAYRVGHDTRLTAGTPAYVWFRSDAWKNFPAGGWEPGPAFLHGRKNDSGDKLLVALELNPVGDDLHFYCRTFEPASFFDAPRVPPRKGRLDGTYHIRRCRVSPVRVFAGQPDPRDSSAFTVKVESEGKAATVRGRMSADGTVSLAVEDEWLRARWGVGPPPRGQFWPPSEQKHSKARSIRNDRAGVSAGY